ncbi:MAG: SDR family oxidoreductase, partial [Planctomycetes bacterium]|nr:SDR family oxidoreductase [Planctomycetota bacterium]
VLVNAAGIIIRGHREFELPHFSRVIEVNLVGTMRTCMTCQEALEASCGCVLNIASMLSFFGSATAPAYSSSKGGIAQLTKSLAVAWAPRGVRVNAIAPGWIETELTAPLVADSETSRRLVQRTPMGRWGQPDDIGGAAVFLCSPWAKFITGVVLPVDGGYSVA